MPRIRAERGAAPGRPTRWRPGSDIPRTAGIAPPPRAASPRAGRKPAPPRPTTAHAGRRSAAGSRAGRPRLGPARHGTRGRRADRVGGSALDRVHREATLGRLLILGEHVVPGLA